MTTVDPNMPMDQIGGSSNYLKKADVPLPHGRLEVMDKITLEPVKDQDGNSEKLYILHFAGDCPPLILKKCHTEALAEAGYPNAASIAGQQIVIYINPDVEFRGKRIGGIRLRKPVMKKPDPVANSIEEATAMAEENLAQQQQPQSAEPQPGIKHGGVAVNPAGFDDDIPF